MMQRNCILDVQFEVKLTPMCLFMAEKSKNYNHMIQKYMKRRDTSWFLWNRIQTLTNRPQWH